MVGKRIILAAFFLAAFACSVYSQTAEVDIQFICNAQTSCQSCIRQNPMCSWCTDLNFNGTSRCFRTGSEQSMQCNSASVQNPRSEVTSTNMISLDNLNQISPDRVEVDLRPGQPATFTLNVRPARNFPLDLYLLMDLSASMSNDLDNLKRLGNDIADEIRDITSNFTLGFGSFVEKTLAPFVNVNPDRLLNPCNSNPPCPAPYSYIHSVTLTSDVPTFTNGIDAQATSSNQDRPEDGFDGFLQAIVCQDLIGWRAVSRKLILYITDAGFHFAGDGKLAGVVRPHPGTCLMGTATTVNGGQQYEEFDVYDYPSIGQINDKLREFDIIPILAAEQGASSIYNALASELVGATVGNLASDSSNVVQLIRTAYETVSQRIILQPDIVPGLSFDVTPVECPTVDNEGFCAGIQIEQTARVNVTLNVVQCSELLASGRQNINVRVLGFGSFVISVNALCSCNCQDTPEFNSTTCSGGNGTLVCGTCECNDGRFGESCQCDSSGLAPGTNATTQCPGSNGAECSGPNRGRCVCGQCQCRQFEDGTGFFGAACECDNFQCDRDPSNNQVCGGPERGLCTCDGTCQCLPSTLSGLPYTGSACDCSPDNNTCIDATNAERPCNGRGVCECGECICENGYDGEFCQTCTNSTICGAPVCDENTQCAMCASNVINEPECAQCNFTMIAQVTDPDFQLNNTMTTPCEFTDRDNCIHRFFVALGSTQQPIGVESERVCPVMVAPWIIAVSIIAALIVAGIVALILAKLILFLLDRYEVNKFQREVEASKFRKNENPIFQDPTKKYVNPIYGD